MAEQKHIHNPANPHGLETVTSPHLALSPDAHIVVKDMTIGYGERVVMRDLNFTIKRGDIFVIMGASGCGKSTLLKVLIGLNAPMKGQVYFQGPDRTHMDFWQSSPAERNALMRHAGTTFQGGALWSSMTLAENIALPLEQYTKLSPAEIRELASYKLSLVGLSGFEEYYPSELSGGMQKRAGLARALALDPEIVFFDEPSAGLDPVSARLLDDLILELRESLGTTIVVVTHELASIFHIATNAMYLDVESRTLSSIGTPQELIKSPTDANVRNFLTRGEAHTAPATDSELSITPYFG